MIDRLGRLIARTWNWKSAILSACGRSAIFFLANLPAGLDDAVAAGQTEFVYRACAAGFYGALTEQFSRLRATRLATLGALVVVPGIAHSLEFAVHRLAGTERIGAAVLVSIAVSVATTRLNLFAMRRGLLVAGRDGLSLSADFRHLARLARSSIGSMKRTQFDA